MKKFLLATTLIAFTGVAASAADLPRKGAPVYKPVVAVPTFSWTGFYAGIQGGWLQTDTTGRVTNNAGLLPFTYDTGKSGGLIGGYVGYNYQFNNNVVVGVEGDINAVFSGKGTNNLISNATAYTVTSRQNYDANLRARLGYSFDRFLPYIAGGVAFGNSKTNISFTNGATFATNDSSRVGYTIGGGLEYAITNNILARVEYRYTDFGRESFGNTAANAQARSDYKSHAVLGGISYKF